MADNGLQATFWLWQNAAEPERYREHTLIFESTKNLRTPL